jgi:hypothetical protein
MGYLGIPIYICKFKYCFNCGCACDFSFLRQMVEIFVLRKAFFFFFSVSLFIFYYYKNFQTQNLLIARAILILVELQFIET